MANLRIVVSTVTKGMNTAVGKFKSFAGKVGGVLKSKLGMLLGGVGAFGAMSMTNRLINTLDNIGKSAKRIGVSAEMFQKLSFAAKRTGASITDVESSFKRMAKTVYNAERGLSTSTDALRRLGVQLKDISGKSPDKQFEILADALNKVQNASTKAALAQEIFGRGGTRIIPMISEYRKLGTELDKIGGIIDNETVKAAEEAADSFENLKTAALGLASSSGIVSEIQRVTAAMDDLNKRLREGRTLAQKFDEALQTPGKFMAELGMIFATKGIKDKIPDKAAKLGGSFFGSIFGDSNADKNAATNTSSQSSAFSTMSTTSVGKVNELRAIGANAGSAGGNAAPKLDRMVTLLESIDHAVNPQTRYEYELVRRHHAKMNMKLDGAKK